MFRRFVDPLNNFQTTEMVYRATKKLRWNGGLTDNRQLGLSNVRLRWEMQIVTIKSENVMWDRVGEIYEEEKIKERMVLVWMSMLSILNNLAESMRESVFVYVEIMVNDNILDGRVSEYHKDNALWRNEKWKISRKRWDSLKYVIDSFL